MKTKHGSSCAAAGLRERRSEGAGEHGDVTGRRGAESAVGSRTARGGCHYGATVDHFYSVFFLCLRQTRLTNAVFVWNTEPRRGHAEFRVPAENGVHIAGARTVDYVSFNSLSVTGK